MAKLVLKSIAYYPQAQSGRPEAHKDLGLIDTDKPYKKLVVPVQNRQLYRLVDETSGEVLKSQKLIRDHNDLKVYVGDVVVVELQDFFSFQQAQSKLIDQEPLYMVDASESSCVRGLVGSNDGMNLPTMYVLWEPGMSVSSCLNPSAMGLFPLPGLAGISGLTFSGLIGMSGAIGALAAKASSDAEPPIEIFAKLSGKIIAGPVIAQTSPGQNASQVSGLKVAAFDNKGNNIGTGVVDSNGNYSLQLTVKNYQGALLLKAYDDDPADNITPQYRDEATGTHSLSYTQTWDSNNKLVTIVLSKAGGVTLGEAKDIIESLGYRNTNINNPTPGDRTIALTQLVDAGVIVNVDDKNTVDFSAANNNAKSAVVTVVAINDAPVFTTAPAAAPVLVGLNTTYSLPNSYAVEDPDAGSGNMQISFTLREGAIASGSLAYALSSGVTWVSTTGGVYTFQGTLSQLNNWMRTTGFLTYTPSNNFAGTATIAMAINDQGNTDGPAITTNAANALTLTVRADITAPVLGTVTTNNDGSKIILSYNEPLFSTVLDKTKFSYTLNNGSTSYNPESVNVNGNTIELNLSGNKPANGDVIKVNYNAPTPSLSGAPILRHQTQ